MPASSSYLTSLAVVWQFGEIDIDSELVVSKDTLPDSGDQIMMLNNGCLCCTVKDDLVNMLNDLVSSFARCTVRHDLVDMLRDLVSGPAC